MGIEIRPAAMINLLNDKASKFNIMKETFARSKQAIYQFIHDDTLKGAAYSAAKERFSYDFQLIEAFELLVDRSKQIDSNFKRVIESYWGSMSEVSEDYWVSERCKVLHKIAYFQEKAEQAERQIEFDPTDFVSRARAPYYRMQVGAYQNMLKIPDEMIRQIHSYCDETNFLYVDSDLNALDTSIGQGISAFYNAKFNPKTKTWPKLDTSWCEGMAENVKKVKSKYCINLTKEDDSALIINGDYFYYQGKEYNKNDKESFDLLQTIWSESLSGVEGALRDNAIVFGLENGIQYIGSQRFLANVGIEKAGEITFKDGYAIFKGFKMAEDAGRMTTRCKIENLANYSKASAAVNNLSFYNVAKGVGTYGGYVVGGIFTVTGSIDAYWEEYKKGEGLPEDIRISNSEAESENFAGKSFVSGSAGSAVGWGLNTYIMGQITASAAAAGTAVAPGVGTLIGAGAVIVGSAVTIVASIGWEALMKSDSDGNGQTLEEEIKDLHYRDKQVNPKGSLR